MKFKIDLLAPDVHLVRFLIGDGPAYDRFTTVTELNEGRTLRLAGWCWEPPTFAEGYALRRAHFPLAREIEFERKTAEGSRTVTIPIRSLAESLLALYVAHLRAFYGVRPNANPY